MNQDQENTLFRQKLDDFFDPSQKNCPVALASAIAIQSLAVLGPAETLQKVQLHLRHLLGDRPQLSGGLPTWERRDVLFAQGLRLYVLLAARNGGWVQKDGNVLKYLIELFWKVPDRIISVQEEETDCRLHEEACMPESKRLLFSEIVEYWQLSEVREPDENAKQAFQFICEVFGQNPKHATTKANRALLIKCGEPQGRWKLHHEDRKIYIPILTKHCEQARVKALTHWLPDDLPSEVIRVFQRTMLGAPETELVLSFLRFCAVKPRRD